MLNGTARRHATSWGGWVKGWRKPERTLGGRCSGVQLPYRRAARSSYRAGGRGGRSVIPYRRCTAPAVPKTVGTMPDDDQQAFISLISQIIEAIRTAPPGQEFELVAGLIAQIGTAARNLGLPTPLAYHDGIFNTPDDGLHQELVQYKSPYEPHSIQRILLRHYRHDGAGFRVAPWSVGGLKLGRKEEILHALWLWGLYVKSNDPPYGTLPDLQHPPAMTATLQPSDMAALRRHAEEIRRHEEDEAQKPRKPKAATLRRVQAWWERIHQVPVGVKPGELFTAPDDPDADYKLRRFWTRIENFRRAYRAAHPRPAIEPWDTPEKIAAFVEEAVATEREAVVMLPGSRAAAREKLKEAYVEARGRILAFARLAPSVVRDELVRVVDDPAAGMQNLKAWCDSVIVCSHPASHHDDAIPADDVGLTTTVSLGVASSAAMPTGISAEHVIELARGFEERRQRVQNNRLAIESLHRQVTRHPEGLRPLTEAQLAARRKGLDDAKREGEELIKGLQALIPALNIACWERGVLKEGNAETPFDIFMRTWKDSDGHLACDKAQELLARGWLEKRGDDLVGQLQQCLSDLDEIRKLDDTLLDNLASGPNGDVVGHANSLDARRDVREGVVRTAPTLLALARHPGVRVPTGSFEKLLTDWNRHPEIGSNRQLIEDSQSVMKDIARKLLNPCVAESVAGGPVGGAKDTPSNAPPETSTLITAEPLEESDRGLNYPYKLIGPGTIRLGNKKCENLSKLQFEIMSFFRDKDEAAVNDVMNKNGPVTKWKKAPSEKRVQAMRSSLSRLTSKLKENEIFVTFSVKAGYVKKKIT